jgi:hypothetical protein
MNFVVDSVDLQRNIKQLTSTYIIYMTKCVCARLEIAINT